MTTYNEEIDEGAETTASSPFNSADKSANVTLSDLDRYATNPSTNAWRAVRNVDGKNTGKWYCEFAVEDINGDGSNVHCGMMLASHSLSKASMGASQGYHIIQTNTYVDGTATSHSVTSVANGDRMGFAVDFDAGKIWLHINGTWAGGGNPEAGTGERYSSIPVTNNWFPDAFMWNGADMSIKSGASDQLYRPYGFDPWAGVINEISESAAAGFLHSSAIEEPIADATYTLNPSDKHGDIALSNSDRTATQNTSNFVWRSVRSIVPRSTGKWYFEFTWDAGAAALIAIGGIGSSSFALTEHVGQTGYGYGDGYKYFNNVSTALSTGPIGAVIGIAVDLDAGKIWFLKNGVAMEGDPAAGTGASYTGLASQNWYPALSLNRVNTATVMSIALEGKHLAYDPPAGFAPWSGSGQQTSTSGDASITASAQEGDIAETAATSTTEAALLALAAVIAETAGISDAQDGSTNAEYSDSVAESSALTDALNAGLDMLVAITESLAASSAESATATLSAAVAETEATSTTQGANINMLAAIAESLATLDAVVARLSLFRDLGAEQHMALTSLQSAIALTADRVHLALRRSQSGLALTGDQGGPTTT